MKTVEIIKKIESDNSRLFKESIIEEAWNSGNREFFEGCILCYNSFITFGIQKVPEIVDEDDELFQTTYTFTNFKKLTESLSKRELTGNAARDAVKDAANQANIDEWNLFFRRILIKDLRCGLSETTINKVLKKISKTDKDALNYIIPVFSCQLAQPENQSKFIGEKLIDVKLDGCLSSEWEIEFEDGRKLKIKEVVENKIEGKVKSKNIVTGKIVYNDITGWAKNGIDVTEKHNSEWFILTLENNIELPPLTGNHLVWLPKLKCWRRVDLLKEGDILLSE